MAGQGPSQASAADESAATARKLELQRRGSWQGSLVTEAHIDWARKSRRIPPGVACRVPPEGETSPVPHFGERVIFLSHLQRGFALPASDFFRGFLDTFHLQPHHLPPNAFVFLSTFVSLFEGYLGIWPSIRHWCHYFSFRAQTIQGLDTSDKPLVPCGAASVIPRRGTEFIRVPGLQSAHKWQCTYFYVSNKGPEDFINLPAYVAGPPANRSEWASNHTDMLVIDVVITSYIERLVAEGKPTADDLMCAWIRSRINPLQMRSHKMCHISGPKDPTRFTTCVLNAEMISQQVRSITDSKLPPNWEWGKSPLRRDRPAPEEVSSFTDFPHTFFRHCLCRSSDITFLFFSFQLKERWQEEDSEIDFADDRKGSDKVDPDFAPYTPRVDLEDVQAARASKDSPSDDDDCCIVVPAMARSLAYALPVGAPAGTAPRTGIQPNPPPAANKKGKKAAVKPKKDAPPTMPALRRPSRAAPIGTG